MAFPRLVVLTMLLAVVLICAQDIKKSRHHRDATRDWPESSGDLEALVRESVVVASAKRETCATLMCGRGRECQMNAMGEAECVCARKCRKHNKLVCGTDGILYSSHCELHRAACITGKSIAIDHSYKCLRRKELYVISPTSTPSSVPVSHVPSSEWTFPEAHTETPTPEEAQTTPQDVASSELPLINPLTTAAGPVCSQQEYEILKDNLLLYNHARLMSGEERSPGKDYLVSLMFSHYDDNNNGLLEREELLKAGELEHLSQLAKDCSLTDMLLYDDTDHDKHLNINEFYVAFSKLYSVSVVSLDKALEVNHVSARVGDNVEIKCDVTGSPSPPIVWRRHGTDLANLAEDEMRVFADGSLYITRVQLVHAGNYTCHAQRNKDVVQTHVLTVHTLPQVRVTPRIQSRRPGEEATMMCHVVGEPFPKVEWLKNDELLREIGEKYEVLGNGTELKIRNIAYSDTGAFMCQGSNIGGLARDISSLVVQEESSPAGFGDERRFFAFHDWGVSVYEPQACRLHHLIQSTDIVPGTQDYVCGDKGVNCSWGRAINVADRYIYASQPNKDRILVISQVQMVVVDVVMTDRYPVDLYYVEHLDQVWVVNWRGEDDRGVKTIQVIRDASQKKKHHTVHPEPIDGHFDLVKALFIPPVQEYGHEFKYGYVTHTNQRGLYKMSLPAMKYTKAIDLAPYNCVPRNLQYSSLYGLIIMECEEPVSRKPTGQLVMDYFTDTVLSHKISLIGQPYLTPDSRILVTVHRERNSVTLVVQETTHNGLRFLFDVRTTLNVSDITFHPSATGHGYDLYGSSADKGDILFLNLATGKVEMVTGVGKALESSWVQWGNPNRPILSAGVFGTYLVSPANEALFIINGHSRTVNCEIGGLVHPRLVVWTNLRP